MELQAILGIEQLRYLAQDETRIGCKTETVRVISAKGIKPKVKVAWPREAFWLYKADNLLCRATLSNSLIGVVYRLLVA
jgi:hypothetical protein